MMRMRDTLVDVTLGETYPERARPAGPTAYR